MMTALEGRLLIGQLWNGWDVGIGGAREDSWVLLGCNNGRQGGAERRGQESQALMWRWAQPRCTPWRPSRWRWRRQRSSGPAPGCICGRCAWFAAEKQSNETEIRSSLTHILTYCMKITVSDQFLIRFWNMFIMWRDVHIPEHVCGVEQGAERWNLVGVSSVWRPERSHLAPNNWTLC